MMNKVWMPVAVAMVCSVSAAEWGTDYEAALAQAKAEGKAVLVDFTGSDWCGYCMQLRAQVLEHTEFSAWAQANFVLLEVDMPKNPKFDDKLREQNNMLCEKYKVDAFPTVLVLDAQGNPLGGLFGYEGDWKIAKGEIELGLKVQHLLQQAESLQGAAKLELLVQAWRLIPEDLQKLNPQLKKDILTLDTGDISGLHAEENAQKRLRECVKAANAAPTDAAALELVEAELKTAHPSIRKPLLEHKFRLLVLLAETHEDVLAAAEVAYAAIEADLRLRPEVKKSRINQMKGVFANPQTMLNRSRMIKRNRPKR